MLLKGFYASGSAAAAISSAKLGTRFLTLMDLSKETFFFRKDEVCEAISYCHSRTTKKEDLEKRFRVKCIQVYWHTSILFAVF